MIPLKELKRKLEELTLLLEECIMCMTGQVINHK